MQDVRLKLLKLRIKSDKKKPNQSPNKNIYLDDFFDFDPYTDFYLPGVSHEPEDRFNPELIKKNKKH